MKNPVPLRSSCTELVYPVLLSAIGNRLVKERTAFLEGPIADSLAISRPPLREALKDLAKKEGRRRYVMGDMASKPTQI